uniref:Uncharacterized protein n=1 Tax=Seriola dumerili TaxID=41447 RepID=A0A3B4T385_SERDU
TLNSYIVSASINNSHVRNLKDRVVVTLSHLTPKQVGNYCIYTLLCGQGGWNNKGCETHSVSFYQTSCHCDHLTHFAVLLVSHWSDVSRTPIGEADSKILTSLNLYLVRFRKLRRDYPSKILINLSAALLGLNMIFLLDAWLSSFSNYGLCIATAASLHYFMLASFTWMGLEAVHMYLALVKVFNIYVPSYILKFCAVGWGKRELLLKNTNYRERRNVLEIRASLTHKLLYSSLIYRYQCYSLSLPVEKFHMYAFSVKTLCMGANKSSANSRSSLQDLRAVGRTGPGFAIYCILPVARRVECYWTAIRHIPAQPAA